MRDQSVGNIISNWQDYYPSLFGKHPLQLEHTIHRSELFSDEALIDLLENAPRENYHVTTMDKRVQNPTYKREGQFGDLSGKEILAAVRKGHIWINLRDPQEIRSKYGELLADIYREFENRVPGLKTYKQKMTILISSPNLKVKYHMDVPGQTLWQMRGRKKVFLYAASAPFMSQQALEKLTINEVHETDIEFKDWYDDHALTFELEPGQMLHWPLNCPHRVENHDSLNVSLTTEHWTNELRNQYAVNFGNAMLRKLGMKNLSQNPSGLGLYAKAAITAATKISGMQKKLSKPYLIDFQVDPDAPDCVRDIPAVEFNK
ncbi:MAG: cupin-like domain-containing protein [Rhizobiaceae bacterium]|nr:cupin-like domain-containing protein [Rhizobiaceae bacterium]MBL4695552.1 cupin-like domain-containing protein [Rhizobiaceae bacterium]